MNVEDLISELVFRNISMNIWDQNVIFSFWDQILKGNGMTEKQGALAIRILKRHSSTLSLVLQQDVDTFLQNPVFRLPVRKISNEKRLSVINHPVFGKAIKAVFPYNEKTVNEIRKNRDTIGQAHWDKDEKCWFFALNEQSIQFVSELDTFELDEILKNYLDQISHIHKNIENYVPMLIIENLKPKLKNCVKNMPVLASNDLVSAIFEARTKGICTWDDTINNFIESDELDPLTREFLKSDPGEKFKINSDTYSLNDISTIVCNLLPVMVIIPGGDELNKMSLACEFFRNSGISNQEMSVMFRLPTNTHAIFNEYVKFNELNSPISENTKVVFVSSKIPKPIFKSKIKFHCILNLGYNNVHYTMQDFVKNQENNIIFAKAKDIQNPTYAFM